MVRVDAGRDPAQVVNVEPFRDGPLRQFVAEAMGQRLLAAVPSTAVACLIERPGPQEAARVRLRHVEILQPLRRRQPRHALVAPDPCPLAPRLTVQAATGGRLPGYRTMLVDDCGPPAIAQHLPSGMLHA